MDNKAHLEQIFTFTYDKMLLSLRQSFLSNVEFYNTISNDKISLSDAKEFFASRVLNQVDSTKVKAPALQKYILKNNGQVGFKNKTALNTIQLLLMERPQTTLADLQKMFESELLNLKKTFEEVDKISQKDKEHPRRYFHKDEEVLITGDNKRVALSTQWGLNFDNFIVLAAKQGYKIAPYNSKN